MWNLSRANFNRLMKSWVFWICAAFLVCAACRSGVQEWVLSRDPGPNSAWDRWSVILFQQVRDMLPFVMGALSSLFLAGEYDGNAIRNKLVPGHSRGAVYCAAVTTISAGAILLFLLHTGIVAVFLRLSFGPFPNHPPVLQDLAAILVMWLAWSALFTAIGMNCTMPAVSVVVCLGAFGVLELITNLFHPIHQRNQVGVLAVVSPFLYDFLPTGQGDQLRDVGTMAEWHLIPYGLLFAVFANSIGALVFCKRDMK